MEAGMDRHASEPGSRRIDYVQLLLLIATAGFLVAWIPVISLRAFDPDEFEHAHAAWCLSKGMVLYKDFFEHHTPWYYYALSPFFRWFSVDASLESARHFLVFGRALSLLLTLASAVLTILIGSRWQERRVGLLAALFLVGQPVFFEKAVEMRPDVMALPFFLAALWLLLRGLDQDADPAARRHLHFFAGGLCLGAAVMCTQKMLFVLPGLLASLGLWSLWFGRRSRRDLLGRVLSTAALLAGVAVPALGTWAGFGIQHAGGEFITNNFLLNAKWRTVVFEQLVRVIETSWPILVLALIGASESCYRLLRAGERGYGALLLLGTLLGLIAGILVVPVAHRQYYLMPFPIACLFAARGLSFLVGWVCGPDHEGVRSWLLVLATIPLSILPVQDVRDAFSQRNDRQLARLAYVFESTKPTDLVMDGWEGTGVFRPHALHNFFLHDEMLDMLSRKQVDAYLDALESGRIRPRLIAMDQRLFRLGSRFVRFVKTNYVAHDEFFYLRKDRAAP
jgi:4-amino-4-deoxy-L-arabinose transferase-like glycosyltransferase